MSKFALDISIASLAFAMLSAIWSIYIDSFVNSMVIVGIIGAVLSICSVISYFVFISLAKRSDKGKLYFYSVLIVLLSYVFFAITRNFYVFMILALIFTAAMALRVMSFGLLVKDNSCRKKLSKNEGIIFTLMNMAYVIGPLLAALVADRFGINSVFALGAVFLLISLLWFKFLGIHDGNVDKSDDRGVLKN